MKPPRFQILIAFTSFLLFFSFGELYAQEIVKRNDAGNLLPTQVIDKESFSTITLAESLLAELNSVRVKTGIDDLQAEVLITTAAEKLVTQFAKNEIVKVEDQAEVEDLFTELGGTSHVFGLATKTGIKKGTDNMNYRELAEVILSKWMQSPKLALKLMDQRFQYIGFSSCFDKEGKSLYVVGILGNTTSFNPGASLIENLPLILEKDPSLKPFDEKLCSKIEKFNLFEIQKGLKVKDGSIYLTSNDLRELKRIIKPDSRDAIAVDIIQKEQFSCNQPNAIDYSRLTKGYYFEGMTANDLFVNNEYEGKEAKTKLKVNLGELPQELGKNFDLNLLVIKDKVLCANVPPSYVYKSSLGQVAPVEFLADTLSLGKLPEISLSVDSAYRMFRIYFKQGKLVYTWDDLKPVIDSLGLPEFFVNEINIAAITSIDKSDTKTMIQLHKTAESIVDIFKKRQNDLIKSDIITQNGWSQFKVDVTNNPKFDYLGRLSLKEALAEIKAQGYQNELEPVFAKHRFAQIELKVTYDLRGEKEQLFALYKFNRALKRDKDLPTALAIQKLIMRKVVEGKYTAKVVDGMDIPQEAKYSGFLMNKLWLSRFVEKFSEEDFCNAVYNLNKLDPQNQYIIFNSLHCKALYQKLTDEFVIFQNQNQLDKLYTGIFGKEILDPLNIEYNVKVISSLDTVVPAPAALNESLQRLKAIFRVNEANWQNSLKLANIFITHKDYDFASKILEPIVEQPKVNEELLFTYLSLCSFSPNRLNSKRFVSTLEKAELINHKRLCALFDGKSFPLQVMENPQIKAFICSKCSGK
jgi:hypothetical protein